ncbi:MAG: sigma-70 family RNA polymerase sigma factor, partial [Alphaproteobacteria bacterium]
PSALHLAAMAMSPPTWPSCAGGQGVLRTNVMKLEPDSPNWAELIEAVALRRDRAAFSTLYEHFAPRIKGFMRRSGSVEGAAEELAQETLLKVWRKADSFDPKTAGAAAWIFTIARNLRIDAFRRGKRRGENQTTDIDAEFVLDETPLPDAMFAASQTDARVLKALSNLSDEQTKVVELSFYQEKAHAEIAEVLQIPLGTVKSRLRLAMVKLRSSLEVIP